MSYRYSTEDQTGTIMGSSERAHFGLLLLDLIPPSPYINAVARGSVVNKTLHEGILRQPSVLAWGHAPDAHRPPRATNGVLPTIRQ